MLLKRIILTVGLLAVVGLSSGWPQAPYKVEKASPTGTYRVQIELRQAPPTGTRDRNERLRIAYFKGNEIIEANEWVNSDQYEPSLMHGVKAVEWVADNVLRISRERLEQPFEDELTVSNNTTETIKYLEVDYGKYQSFHVFDMRPNSRLKLLASPEFKPDRSSNYFLGYGGKTQSGRRFEGTKQSKRRESPAEGPLKFQIVIDVNDLR